MATYLNSDNKSLFLYGVDSSVFPSTSGIWPCQTWSGTYWSTATNFTINGDTIYLLNVNKTTLEAVGNSDGDRINLSFTPTKAGTDFANIVDFPTLVIVCDTNISYNSVSDIEDITNCVSQAGFAYATETALAERRTAAWIGNTEYFSCAYPSTAQVYIKAVTPVGDFVRDGVYVCSTSARHAGASCCTSGSTDNCGCNSSKATPSLCGSSATNVSPCNHISTSTSTPSCVSEDSLILTKKGYKYAKDITQNDILMSYRDGHLIENDSRLNIFIQKDCNDIFKVTFEDDSTLFITDGHPILCDDNKYRIISDIKKEMEDGKEIFVVTTDSKKKIGNIKLFRNNGALYNFLVDGDNFIVDGMVVSCENIDILKEKAWIITGDRASAKVCVSAATSYVYTDNP